MATTTRSRKGKAATQGDTSQEVATQEDTSPPAPQVTQEPAPQEQEQEETPAPKLGGTGVWDVLGFWVTILLMQGDPTLQEKGVTTSQVATYIINLKPQGFSDLVGVGAIPQGAKLSDLHSIPEKGEGGWVRKLENSLWRVCEATPGNKQAGGGKYPQHLLVRNMGQRPVTFTLAEGVTFPQEEEEDTTPQLEETTS